MAVLPPHVAKADEIIPEPNEDAPDMRAVPPVEQMIDRLAQLDDDAVGYVALWRSQMATIGCSVLASYERDGARHLMVGSCCDSQMRHRSRWSHFLADDLDRIEGRRELLLDALEREGVYIDNRPVDPGATTRAMRDFLRTEGRILINPEGRLEEGGGVPRRWVTGTDADRAEIQRASRAYFAARRRWRADRQIRRAVAMLGKPTPNGWLVLEARA